MQRQEEIHDKDALPTSLPTRQDCAEPQGEEEKQERSSTVIVPRPVPTPLASVPTLPCEEVSLRLGMPIPLPSQLSSVPRAPKEMTIRCFLGMDPNEKIRYYELVKQEDLNTESIQERQEDCCDQKSEMDENQEFMDEETLKEELKVEVHRIPPPPSPFQVKAIPDNPEQPSFLSKYGVLANRHEEGEKTDTSLQPPSFAESDEEIFQLEFGGKGAKENHPKAKTGGHAKRNLFAERLKKYCLTKRRQDEWIEEFGIHSGRFKLLNSPIY